MDCFLFMTLVISTLVFIRTVIRSKCIDGSLSVGRINVSLVSPVNRQV